MHVIHVSVRVAPVRDTLTWMTMGIAPIKVCIQFIIYFVHFVVPMGILSWEIWVAFPKETQLQQSRYPTPL